MITRYTESGWEVITQRAHGLLAAELAFHWKVKERPGRWVETILAIAEHDDAENELDGEDLITSGGGPLNYDMKQFDLGHCERLAALTITKSRYMALLTSMHMEFLYGSAKQESKEAVTFLENQKKLRKLWLKELKLSQAEADKIYDLVEFCDAFSLLICNDGIQPSGRGVEISHAPDQRMYKLIKVSDGLLSVSPWPFEETQFEVRYEYRLLPTIQFESTAALRAEILSVPVQEKVWTLVKSASADTTRKKTKSKLAG